MEMGEHISRQCVGPIRSHSQSTDDGTLDKNQMLGTNDEVLLAIKTLFIRSHQ